jgi:hypothetical protein
MNDFIKTIEFLYFGDCPSWKNALDLLKDVLDELKISTDIILTKVETNEEAILHKFQGSPTIKINGKDLFPTNQENFALGCRVYQTPEGFKGSPTRAMIKANILDLIH